MTNASFFVASVIQASGFDVLLHGLLNFVHHLERCAFGGTAESHFNEFLAERFAQTAIHAGLRNASSAAAIPLTPLSVLP